MSKHTFTSDEVIEKIKQHPSQKIRVAIVDFDGVLRGKYINKDKFLSAAKSNFGFCDVVFGWDCADVCYPDTKFTGWHTGFPDANAHIDLNTYRQIPWNDNTPFFLADFRNKDGSALEVCPRSLLKKQIEKAKGMDLEPQFSLEYEFFNFKESPQSWAAKSFTNPEPLTPGMFGYSLLRSTYNQNYFNALIDKCGEFGIPIEGLHTETGPGVYEAAIQYSGALEAADRAVLFKQAAKEIAMPFGIMPTFMAKWNQKLPGCGGHCHQSLWQNGKNAFYDERDPTKMSTTFKHYLAGQMKLFPQLLPMVAPTINSYKRLVEGLWAPTRITWARDNRTVSFRVLPGSPTSTRLESRILGADVNAYLAMTACLAAGLYGIEHKLPLEPETQGNGYKADKAVHLAPNLLAATEIFEKSEVARQILGDAFVTHYAQSRRHEWRQFQEAVTNWEMERYFEII